MYKLISIALFIFCLQVTASSQKIPRQKVYIQGNVIKEKVFKMNELSALPTIEQKIIDPYSSNKTINFTGIYLYEIFNTLGNKNATSMDVIAINDYKVTITKELALKEKMILAYKGDGDYISVANRGPARIVVPGKGILTEGALSKEGINWVWFVKTIIIK